jgi:DNA-binding Lrp family transcriptional regulator
VERVPTKTKLDAQDRAIRVALKGNARIPKSDLARLVGLSEGAIRGRIAWLKNYGAIRSYCALSRPGLIERAPLVWATFSIVARQIGEVGVDREPGQIADEQIDGRSAFQRKARLLCDEMQDVQEQSNLRAVGVGHCDASALGTSRARAPMFGGGSRRVLRDAAPDRAATGSIA